MTETAARIRWTDESPQEFVTLAGRVGTRDEPAFRIFGPDGYNSRWLLSIRLAASSEFTYGADPDDLKLEAERWLEEFVSSLGAIFSADAFEFEEDDEPLEVRYAPGAFVRYQHPDAGWPGEQDEARELLTHGRLYRVAWIDIGQSKTRIGLAGVKGAGFNSVLFEPVAIEDVADAEAAEVARRETTAAEAAREKE